ncbi:TcfC E-set like domain-containing protein [Edwardsiella hoshinae]|nr:TcfC E-set like domain-containing protein [Edwardsiella hoshinae]
MGKQSFFRLLIFTSALAPYDTEAQTLRLAHRATSAAPTELAVNRPIDLAQRTSVPTAKTRELAAVSPTTLALARGMQLASGQSLAQSRYNKILVPSPMSITLVLPQLAEERFDGQLALDSVQIDDAAAVARFLQQAGLQEGYAHQAAAQLAAGAQHDARCKGNRSQCVVPSDGMALVIDYYARQVRLFFAPAWFARNERQRAWLRAGDGQAVLVNHASLSANRYSDSNSLYLRDYGLLGLPGGYLKYDAYATEWQREITDLNYVWQRRWAKAQLGSIGNSYDFNPSAQRGLFRNSQLHGVLLGNSAELRLRHRDDRSYTYYAPLPGVLEVWREDRLLLRRSVSAGIGELAYHQLPTGIYPVRVLLKGLDEALFSSQSLLIVNDGAALEGISSHLSAGRLQRHSYYGNAWMSELGVTIPIGERLSLSGLADYVGGEWLASLGGEMRSNDFSLSLMHSQGNRDYLKSDLTATWRLLSLQFTQERYRERAWARAEPEESAELAALQTVALPSPGFDARQRQSGETVKRSSLLVNYSLALTPEHNLQLGYQRFNEGEQETRNHSYNLSLFSRLPWQLNLTAVASYSRSDMWSVSLGLSRIFGDLQINSNYLQQDHGHWSSQNMLNYNRRLNDAWQVNAQAGQQFTDNGPQSSLSAGATYQHGLDARGQLYLAGGRPLTGSLDVQSSQLLSADGIRFQRPSELSQQSFLRLPPPQQGAMQLGLNDLASGYTRYYTPEQGRIIALPPYSRYRLEGKLIGGNQLFDNRQARYQQQVDLLPGRLIDATRPVITVRSQAVLVRRHGQPVESLRCSGAGCVGVQRLQAGLFMLQLQQNGRIQLQAGDQICATLASPHLLPSDQLPIVECQGEQGEQGEQDDTRTQ